MEPVADKFTDAHFPSRQLARKGMYALYEQQANRAGPLRYEVVRLRIRPAHPWPNGDTPPEHEASPEPTAWGPDGWPFLPLPEALRTFPQLVHGA